MFGLGLSWGWGEYVLVASPSCQFNPSTLTVSKMQEVPFTPEERRGLLVVEGLGYSAPNWGRMGITMNRHYFYISFPKSSVNYLCKYRQCGHHLQ